MARSYIDRFKKVFAICNNMQHSGNFEKMLKVFSIYHTVMSPLVVDLQFGVRRDEERNNFVCEIFHGNVIFIWTHSKRWYWIIARQYIRASYIVMHLCNVRMHRRSSRFMEIFLPPYNTHVVHQMRETSNTAVQSVLSAYP